MENRHSARLLSELRDVAARIDVPDLRDVHWSRELDARQVALVSPHDVPNLDPAAVEVDEFTVASASGPGPRVRFYRPRGVGRGGGALVFAHGGAFCLGDLDTDDVRCLFYAQHAGCTVISVDYALAPECPYPAAVDDFMTVVTWVATKAVELGVDSRRICVGGESAGGCLAAAVALRCRDGELDLCAQMLLFPVIDHRLQTPAMADGADMPAWDAVQSRRMWELYLRAVDGPVTGDASPALADDLSGLPRALIVTADVDPLRDDGLAYAQRLAAARVATDLHNYAGTFHVFDLAAPRTAVAQRALREQADFLSAVCA